MKKYILTIKYDDINDEVEWIQEEIIVQNSKTISLEEDISNLTCEDMLDIMESKDNAKA